MREVTSKDLEHLAIGAAILGTGGGGDPYIGKVWAQQALEEEGPVRLLSPDEIDDEALVVSVGGIGAPTVLIEKIPEGSEPVHALRVLERRLGRPVDAVCPAECGGVNSMIPFVAAAKAGLPVLDGDGMGRAFPEIQMLTFNVYGISGSPSALVDERGTEVLIETDDNEQLEWIARGITIRMGGQATMADYAMSGADFKRAAVRDTISMCMKIGEAVVGAKGANIHPVEAVCEATRDTIYGKGILLFQGKVVDVERRTTEGFTVGRAVLEGLEGYRGSEMVIRFQNENLVAVRDRETVASVPDLICLLDSERGTAITTERLRYGQRVHAVGIPSPEIMRTEEALRVWGPRAFGYDMTFTPLEKRFAEFHSGDQTSEQEE